LVLGYYCFNIYMTKGVPVYMPKKEYKCKYCGIECDSGWICEGCKSRRYRERLKLKEKNGN